jgi:hypothetical protein
MHGWDDESGVVLSAHAGRRVARPASCGGECWRCGRSRSEKWTTSVSFRSLPLPIACRYDAEGDTDEEEDSNHGRGVARVGPKEELTLGVSILSNSPLGLPRSAGSGA